MTRRLPLFVLAAVLSVPGASAWAQAPAKPDKPGVKADPKKPASKTEKKPTEKAKVDPKAPKEASAKDAKASTPPDTLEGLREYAQQKLDAALKHANERLKTSLESLDEKPEVTPAMVQELKSTLVKTLQGTVKPSETSALKLAQNLATLTADGKLEGAKTLAIQADVQALMFSGSFSDTLLKELRTAIASHAKGASLATSDLDAVLADVETLAKTAKDNLLNPVKPAGPAPKKPG